MALFNEIQVGRYSALLQRLFAIKGAAPSPQLSSEIMPTFPLEVDRPEWKYLANERLCWGVGAQAAVAGERSHVQLVNPTQSSALMVIERLLIAPTGGTTVRIGHMDSPMSGGGVAQAASGFRDSRLARGSQVSSGQVWTGSDAAVLVTSQLHNVGFTGTPNPGFVMEHSIVLTPGTGLGLACFTVNIPLSVNFAWRERKLEPDELLE